MKKVLLITVFSLFRLNLLAQSNKNLLFGTTASFDFGGNQESVEINPALGVQVLPGTYIALGPTISFYSTNNTAYHYESNITIKSEIEDKILYWGEKLVLQYSPFEHKPSPIKYVFVQSSYQTLRGNGIYIDKSGQYKYSIDNYTPFAGIGYKLNFWDLLNLDILLNIKLNNEADSPYHNPIVRIGIEF